MGQSTSNPSNLADCLPRNKSTYLVSAPIIALYYTQLVGDAQHLPTLLASKDFSGLAVIGQFPP